jgi:predicted small lipoprotein YifL
MTPRLGRPAAILVILAVAGCGEAAPVNPPTEPAAPVTAPDPAAPADTGTVSMVPGRGPTSFVGRWAADVSWCANTQGPERPIEITPTRFEGYENSCSIGAVDQVADGYVATLACVAEGMSSQERVKLSVADGVLRLTWLDRGVGAVALRKCTTLAETPDGSTPSL